MPALQNWMMAPHVAAYAASYLMLQLRILGAVFIILTLTWVNFSRLFTGLHSYA